MAALASLWNGRLYGLEIIRFLESHSRLVLAEGTIYPALHRLEESALLSSRWEIVGGRRRRVYALSSRGRQAAGERSASWRRFSRAVDAVLTPATEPRR